MSWRACRRCTPMHRVYGACALGTTVLALVLVLHGTSLRQHFDQRTAQLLELSPAAEHMQLSRAHVRLMQKALFSALKRSQSKVRSHKEVRLVQKAHHSQSVERAVHRSSYHSVHHSSYHSVHHSTHSTTRHSSVHHTQHLFQRT